MKKQPVRMCAACRQARPKKELVRVVRSPEGEIAVDLSGKKPGRGVYLCPRQECLEKARKQKSLTRALECEIPEEVWERLALEMEQAADDA